MAVNVQNQRVKRYSTNGRTCRKVESQRPQSVSTPPSRDPMRRACKTHPNFGLLKAVAAKVSDLTSYLPSQITLLHHRLANIEAILRNYSLASSSSMKAPAPLSCTFKVYTSEGGKPADLETVAALRNNPGDVILFVDDAARQVRVKNVPRKLSLLQFELLTDRLINFWSAPEVDDLVLKLWNGRGFGKDPRDPVKAVRSVCHDLNRNIDHPLEIFLQVADRRVMWRSKFSFCLIVEVNRFNTNQQEIMATDRE